MKVALRLGLIALTGIGCIFALNVAAAQTAVEEPTAVTTFFPWIENATQLVNAIVALLGAFATLQAAALSVMFVKKRKTDQRVRGLTSPKDTRPAKFTSALILGIGGAGKTSIRKRIFQQAVQQERKTTRVEIFNTKISDQTGTNDLYVADYVGQNLGSLVRTFVEEQQVEYSPLRYGFINALIIVVDAVNLEPGIEGADVIRRPISTERVQEQLLAWNHQALSAVYGMLTTSLSYVCLFINKADALTANDQNEARLRALFAELQRSLARRSGSAKVEIIYGSAHSGQGVPELAARLREIGFPIDDPKFGGRHELDSVENPISVRREAA